MKNRQQLVVFFAVIAVYALCAFASYAFFLDELAASANAPLPDMGVSAVVLGLANAGIILVLYSLLGLAGYGLARKLGLPGIFSPDGNWRRWFLIPLGIGLACGAILVAGDVLLAPVNGFGRFPHPAFPASILASMSAGIGEEIAFRGFVLGLWGFLLNWLLRRFQGRTAALWTANVAAALAFGAGHLGTTLYLTEALSIAALSPVLLAEVFVLNGFIGVLAGWRYMKDGLVAASGVHFWTDVVFHVVWGSFS
jgi:membrane protease YdiL (CAAX protease family)